MPCGSPPRQGSPRPAYAANIVVNTTADVISADAACSLREAIVAANTDAAFGGCQAGAGADTITLGSGTFLITLSPGPDENASATGDFDVTGSLTISGAGAGTHHHRRRRQRPRL